MKRLLLFGLLAAIVFIETIAQHGPEYQLKEIQATRKTKKLENILLFSAGSTHDRLFAENLNHALQSQLKRKTATVSYQFLPLSDSDTNIVVNTDTAAAYDAVLLLLPDSLSSLSIRIKSTPNGSVLLSGYFLPQAHLQSIIQGKFVTNRISASAYLSISRLEITNHFGRLH
jgi:hypothetical protein